jgi:hypothetical protein
MYISYSGFKTYLTCPREYWHKYLGKTKVSTQDNRINMLYGSAVGTIFESFYNDRIWKEPDVLSTLLSLVEPTVKRIIQEEVRRGGAFNWADPKANYHSVDSIYDEVRKSIPNGLAIIKTHRFLGPVAVAEMKLDYDVEGHTLGGRADFVIERTHPHSDLIILDGKGSKHRGKFVDGMQLRWYAMLYRFRYHRIPDKLGFVFWRWGPNKAVDWVDFTPEGLEDLCKEILANIAKIEAGQAALRGCPPSQGGPFPAIPEERQCSLCSFVTVCPEGSAKTKSPLTLAPGGVAVEDVSLDDP